MEEDNRAKAQSGQQIGKEPPLFSSRHFNFLVRYFLTIGNCEGGYYRRICYPAVTERPR